MKKADRREIAVGLPRPNQLGFVEAGEIFVVDLQAHVERIVIGAAFGRVEMRNLPFVSQIVSQRVAKTIDIRAIVRQSAKHVEIDPVAVRGVVEPIAAADVVTASIIDALDLLRFPKRLVATLRA